MSVCLHADIFFALKLTKNENLTTFFKWHKIGVIENETLKIYIYVYII